MKSFQNILINSSFIILASPLLIGFFLPSLSHAYSSGYGKTYENYDDIVNRLSRSSYKPRRRSNQRKKWREQGTRAGLGLSQTFIDPTNASPVSQGGLLISMGMNLFSQNWELDGTFQNYGRQEKNAVHYRLREFSLKFLYKAPINYKWNIHLGPGFSSRFLKVDNTQTRNQAEFNTPSFLATLGINTFLNNFFSIGADFNYKSSLVSDTIDRRSIDLTLRLDAHF